MPIVAHNDLPTFARLREEGVNVLPPDRALHQDIRELHIGLLNMMPDKALAATERQFFRLIGESNPIAQFYVHPFSLAELDRSAAARAHIERWYEPFDQIRERGLDALIMDAATALDIPTAPLEAWQDMFALLTSGTFEEQLDALRLSLVDADAQDALIVSLTDAYFAGQIALSWHVSRYTADGALDTSFGDAGVARTGLYTFSDIPLALVAQPDGRAVLAAMDPYAQDHYLACFNTAGVLDPGFGEGGIIHAGQNSSGEPGGGSGETAGGHQ